METSIEGRIRLASAAGFDPEKVGFDVWDTSEGGLATWVSGERDYVLIRLPDGHSKGLGKPLPAEWDVAPANGRARADKVFHEMGWDS